MPEGKEIEIKAAKGRPMLTWVGKRPLRHVIAYPAQLVETFTAGGQPRGGQPKIIDMLGEEILVTKMV